MKKINICLGIFILILIFAGCQPPKMGLEKIVKADYPIATIDGITKIMATDLYRRLASSELLMEGGIIDSTVYFDTLKAIVLDSLVAARAETVDLRKDRSLYRTYRMRFDDFLVNFLYRKIIVDSIKVDSLDAEQYYRNHPEMFSYQEQVRARQLTISGTGLRYSLDSAIYKNYPLDQLDSIARIKIYQIKEKLDSGADFNQMAYDYSSNRETGKKGGDMGYFPRMTYNKEFEEQAFSLPIGTISQPFKSPDGWHIIQILDHVDSGMAKFEGDIYKTALQQCRREMVQKRGMHYIDSLMKPVQVKFNDSALIINAYIVPDTVWAAIIDSRDTITFYRLGDIFNFYANNRKLDTLTLSERHDALMQEITKHVLVYTAENMGLLKEPEAASEQNTLMQKYCRAMILKEREDLTYAPPDSMIADYYERNIDNYRFRKPIYVQHIIIEDSIFGEYLRDQALSGVDFLELAKQYYPGAQEIRVAAADLGYIGPGEMPDNFYSAAMATNKGSVSYPVKTEWGYHIIKVVDRKFDVTLTEARLKISEILKRQHDREYAWEWEKKQLADHKIEYDLSRLKKIELPAKARR
jgi:parvulin-like peptidyl-prolyl isomerase